MADNDPRRAAPDITPPSRVLHQDAGMVSQADMAASSDDGLEQQRRDTINPSLAREQPPDADAPASDAPESAEGGTDGTEQKREGWWRKDPKGQESPLDHSNMHPDNLKTNDM